MAVLQFIGDNVWPLTFMFPYNIMLQVNVNLLVYLSSEDDFYHLHVLHCDKWLIGLQDKLLDQYVWG